VCCLGLEARDQAGDLSQRHLGQGVQLGAFVPGDVLPVGSVAQTVLGFEQRGTGDDCEAGEFLGVGSPEAFREMRGRTRHRLLDLSSAHPIPRQRTIGTGTINGLFVRVAGLPRAKLCESSGSSTHAVERSTRYTVGKQARSSIRARNVRNSRYVDRRREAQDLRPQAEVRTREHERYN